jgi:hypothetical protein
LAKGS